jgi:hypothetical protein
MGVMKTGKVKMKEMTKEPIATSRSCLRHFDRIFRIRMASILPVAAVFSVILRYELGGAAKIAFSVKLLPRPESAS